MNRILQNISAIYPGDSRLISALLIRLMPWKIEGQNYLLTPGNVCTGFYILEQGAMVAFRNDPAVRISEILYDRDFIICTESFFYQIPTDEGIRATEDCLLYAMSFSDMIYMRNNFPIFNMMLVNTFFDGCVNLIKTMDVLKGENASTRYEWLKSKSPGIEKHVPAKYLASYLGMSVVKMSQLNQLKL